MNLPLQPKFNIEKDSKELKIYMFTIQGGQILVEVQEDFKAIMAYSDEEAINLVRADYPMGFIMQIKKRAEVGIKRIVDAVNLTPAPIKMEIVSPTKEKTEAEFVYSMMMIADKFVESKRDQATLKRILGKIKIT